MFAHILFLHFFVFVTDDRTYHFQAEDDQDCQMWVPVPSSLRVHFCAKCILFTTPTTFYTLPTSHPGWLPSFLTQFLPSSTKLLTGVYFVMLSFLSWISVLQNSKEEALNQAFKGDQHVGENNIVQELTKAILVEVKRMTGNDVCCDCGAPSEWQHEMLTKLVPAFVTIFFPLRPNVAVHQPGNSHLHWMFRDPQGAGSPLLQDPVSDSGCTQHLRALGKSLIGHFCFINLNDLWL